MERSLLDPSVPPPSAALRRAVASCGPVRTRRPWRELAFVVALSLAYASGLLGIVFHRPLRSDLAARSVAYLVGFGLLWALAFLIPMILVLLPGRGRVLPRVAAARIAVAAFSIVLVVLPFVATDGSATAPGALAPSIRACLSAGLAVALVPLVAGIVAVRRVVLVGARTVGAALGTAGGALGGLVLHLHCASCNPVHLAIGHGGAVIIGALVGAVLGQLVE